MIKKFIHTSITILLALSLIVAPGDKAFASSLTENNVATVNSIQTFNVADTYYEEVIKTAEKKASVLTTIYGISNVQYALIDNGKIVLTGSSKSPAYDSTVNDDTMYGIASISKVFTAAAVMQLVEQGKIDLDTPVVQYLPDFSMEDIRYKDITVRMLLNHSSGLMGSTFENSILFDDVDFTSYHRFLDNLKTSRLKANPGEYSVYCNDGFTLAEVLVEKISGMSFTEYVKKFISEPLKMQNTKTPLENFQRSSLAKTYVTGNKKPLPAEALTAIGAGGLYSSAIDLCKFAEIFMKNSTSQVLSLASVTLMEQPEYQTELWPEEEYSVINYGLGWDSVDTYPFSQYGIKALAKGGDTNLYHGNLTVLPEENMAIAVLSSGGSSTYCQLMAQEILLTALKEKGTIKDIIPNKTFKKPIPDKMPAELKSFEGIYAHFSSVMKVSIGDDGVATLTNAFLPEAGSQQYIYTGDGKFYFTDGSAYISFEKASNGNTYIYCYAYATVPSLGQTISTGYQAQKLEANPIANVVKQIWEKRAKKKYFIVSEKYSSQMYFYGLPSTELSLLADLEGYCANTVIQSRNEAISYLQIPSVYGRDLSDYTFYTKDGIEYLKANSYTLVEDTIIKNLSTKSSFTCTIGSDGYTKWYKIPKSAANKKIKIKLPRNSSVVVYDEFGNCKYYSLTADTNVLELPTKGHIAFIGDAKAKFNVSYVK